MADLDKVVAELHTKLRKLKMEVGMEIKERVENRTPVESGRLKRGWGFTPKQTSLEFYNVVEYASFVEYGTENMAPRGMLRSTLMELPEIIDTVAKKLGIDK